MSEEDIIDIIKNLSINEYEWYLDSNKYQGHNEEISKIVTKAIQGLLDLYNKEKEKNERLVDRTIKYDKTLEHLQRDTIRKDKIKELLNKLNADDSLEAQIAMPYIRELLEERN